MALEKHDPPPIVETPLEKAHTASEGHFGHSACDAHQARSGANTAQALGLGGFPKVGSAISDPNKPAQAQATASDNKPHNTSEPAES